MAKKKKKKTLTPEERAFAHEDSLEVARAARKSALCKDPLDAMTIYSLAESGQVRQSMIVRGGVDGPTGYHWNPVWKKHTAQEFVDRMEGLGFKVQIHLKKSVYINYEKAIRVPKQLTPLTKPQLKQVVQILKLREQGFTYAKVEEKLDMIGARVLLVRAEKLEETII